MSTQNRNDKVRGRGTLPRPGRETEFLLLLLLGVLIVLTGCAPSLEDMVRPVPNRPATWSFKTKPSVVRQAVDRVLLAKGFELDSERSNPLRLQTQWLRDGRFRTRVKADIKPLPQGYSELTFQIFQEKRELQKEIWHPLEVVGDKVYHDFKVEVDLEIYRVLYEGP